MTVQEINSCDPHTQKSLCLSLCVLHDADVSFMSMFLCFWKNALIVRLLQYRLRVGMYVIPHYCASVFVCSLLDINSI